MALEPTGWDALNVHQAAITSTLANIHRGKGKPIELKDALLGEKGQGADDGPELTPEQIARMLMGPKATKRG